MENKNMVEKLYEYLKDKYGVQGTETSEGSKLGVPMKIEISVPDVAKNNSEHNWVAFLEKQDSEKVNALIIGDHWRDEHCSWARYIEVKNNGSKDDFAWFKIIDNTYLGHGYDFKTLVVFINVLQEFSTTI